MHTGKIILAGAGPGDPGLVTVKLAGYLQQADVVITDRLVSEELIQAYVNPGATVIFAGKEGYAEGSASQASINDLLVQYYQPGQLLVRLKGGDVAFYANVLDELRTLQEHQIPYEIVPGITAASGAAAYCGIPLTARGYADSVRFVTFYNKQEEPESYWQELAQTNDTLVFYMSGEKLHTLAQNLVRQGISADKAIAVIEQATTPYQKVILRRFTDTEPIRDIYTSPTLIIIGRVVNLYPAFRWKANSKLQGSYFRRIRATEPERQLL